MNLYPKIINKFFKSEIKKDEILLKFVLPEKLLQKYNWGNDSESIIVIVDFDKIIIKKIKVEVEVYEVEKIMDTIEVKKICGLCCNLEFHDMDYFCPIGNTTKEWTQDACYKFELGEEYLPNEVK